MSMRTFKKDSGSTLDYTIDFGGWLESTEGISAAAWSRSPNTITIGTSSYANTVSADGKRCTVWLIGGANGVTYTITVNVTTNNSPARIDERSFLVQVGEL